MPERARCSVSQAAEDHSASNSVVMQITVCQLWHKSLPYNIFHKFTVLLQFYSISNSADLDNEYTQMSWSPLFLALHFPPGCIGWDFQTRWACLTVSLSSIRKCVVTLLMHHIYYAWNETRNIKRQITKNNQQAVVSLQRKNARAAPIFSVSQSKDHMRGKGAANKSALGINGFAFLKGQNCNFANPHYKLCNDNSTKQDSVGYLA